MSIVDNRPKKENKKKKKATNKKDGVCCKQNSKRGVNTNNTKTVVKKTKKKTTFLLAANNKKKIKTKPTIASRLSQVTRWTDPRRENCRSVESAYATFVVEATSRKTMDAIHCNVANTHTRLPQGARKTTNEGGIEKNGEESDDVWRRTPKKRPALSRRAAARAVD